MATLPGWALSWRKIVYESWGFDVDGARQFFQDCHTAIVLFDTERGPRPRAAAEEFAAAVGLPLEVVSVGTGRLQELLQQRLAGLRRGTGLDAGAEPRRRADETD